MVLQKIKNANVPTILAVNKTDNVQDKEALLPHLQKLGGKLLYRFRPNEKSIMHSDGDPPYEIHIITFNSKEELQNYLENDERKKYLHLKEDSVSTILSIKEVI